MAKAQRWTRGICLGSAPDKAGREALWPSLVCRGPLCKRLACIKAFRGWWLLLILYAWWGVFWCLSLWVGLLVANFYVCLFVPFWVPIYFGFLVRCLEFSVYSGGLGSLTSRKDWSVANLTCESPRLCPLSQRLKLNRQISFLHVACLALGQVRAKLLNLMVTWASLDF